MEKIVARKRKDKKTEAKKNVVKLVKKNVFLWHILKYKATRHNRDRERERERKKEKQELKKTLQLMQEKKHDINKRKTKPLLRHKHKRKT